jgi:hypothetical protein
MRSRMTDGRRLSDLPSCIEMPMRIISAELPKSKREKTLSPLANNHFGTGPPRLRRWVPDAPPEISSDAPSVSARRSCSDPRSTLRRQYVGLRRGTADVAREARELSGADPAAAASTGPDENFSAAAGLLKARRALIIGLTGPSGAHKTQVAKHLVKAHGFGRMHAGAPAKAAVRAMSGMSRDQVKAAKDDRTMMLGGADTRDLHEAVSDAMHRTAPNLTSMKLERRLRRKMGKGKSNIVVDGVRSPKEAAVIKSMGGMIARCDNGQEPDDSKPMDMLQRGVMSSYTLDTSGPKKSDRQDKTDAMIRDCMT